MTEFWKSLPKKYCDFCKCWYADNKSSVEFHEKGFRHLANVQRKLTELRKRGSKQEKTQAQYNTEMMRIEAAAMKAFENDISSNPQLASQLSSTTSMLNKIPTVENKPSSSSSSSSFGTNRFGESSGDQEESQTLVFGRQKALDTIAKKMEKKSKWLEAKTSEGKTYYWNKETMQTKWECPKSGFLSAEEQKHYVAPDERQATCNARYDPYGSWKTVQTLPYDEKMIDLQLPGQSLPEIVPTIESQELVSENEKKKEFKEKTIETIGGRNNSLASVKETTFKKRKSNNDMKRNVRRRNDDD